MKEEMKIYPDYYRTAQKVKWFFGGLIALEFVGFIGSYVMYIKMNRSRDFRYKVYNYDQRILDAYYTVGEKLGKTYAIRQGDYKAWDIHEIKRFRMFR